MPSILGHRSRANHRCIHRSRACPKASNTSSQSRSSSSRLNNRLSSALSLLLLLHIRHSCRADQYPSMPGYYTRRALPTAEFSRRCFPPSSSFHRRGTADHRSRPSVNNDQSRLLDRNRNLSPSLKSTCRGVLFTEPTAAAAPNGHAGFLHMHVATLVQKKGSRRLRVAVSRRRRRGCCCSTWSVLAARWKWK